jgi:hypothetical protein
MFVNSLELKDVGRSGAIGAPEIPDESATAPPGTLVAVAPDAISHGFVLGTEDMLC